VLAGKRVICASLVALAAIAGCSEDKKSSKQTPATPREARAQPGAPTQSAAELSTPLAKVDDVVITIGELQDQLNRQSPYIRARYASLEQKKEFLESLIRFEVLAKEALRLGYDKDPEVVRTMKQVMIQKLMKEEFEQKLTPDSVPEADMQAYYQANLAEYVKPEEIRASAIVIKTKAQAQKVATIAGGDAGKTNKGFRDLVTKYSTDEEGKLRGGDLRYFARDAVDLPKPVVDAAFALVQTGDVSGVIDGGDGKFYVLKQTGRRRAVTKSFDDAKPQIRNKLYRDKRVEAQNAFVADLKAKATIEINTDNLKKVRIDTSTASGYVDDGHNKMEGP
jgi:peptidyl-prolyl cis-trans isomerase C